MGQNIRTRRGRTSVSWGDCASPSLPASNKLGHGGAYGGHRHLCVIIASGF
jgi:hypothetical protein